MKSTILFLMIAATIITGDITTSKDSLRTCNPLTSVCTDSVTLVNHTSTAVYLDSAFILFDEFDTTGSGRYGLDGRLQVQCTERNSPKGKMSWKLEKIDEHHYFMKQQISAVYNPVSLYFSGQNDTLQIASLQIGTCLGCSGIPTWSPLYIKGKMELRFSNGQTLFLRIFSDDLRNPALKQPCTSYGCDSTVVRKILDDNDMADVPLASFSTVINSRIVSLRLEFNLTADFSLPKQLTNLSSQIGKLSALQQLIISGNKLVALPVEIGRLGSLTSLSASRNLISVLPDSITHCTNLQALSFDENRIEKLPDSLYQLHSLKTLDVGHNKLTSLPPNIEKLDSLRLLFIAGNSICTLPDQVIAWKKKLPMYISSRLEPEWPDSQSCGGTNINNHLLPASLGTTSIIRSIVKKKGVLAIETGVGAKSVSLFDAAGRVAAKENVPVMQRGFNTFRLNTSSLRGGVYYLSVETNKRSVYRKCVQILSVGFE